MLNAVYSRQSLIRILGLTNDLINGGQPRAKHHLHKVKLNHVLKPVFSSVGWPLSTKSLANLLVHIRPCLKDKKSALNV